MSRGAEGHAGTEGVASDQTKFHARDVIEEVLLNSDATTPFLRTEAGDIAWEVIGSLESHGFVIALAQDVLTADQRAAIGRVQRMAAAGWAVIKVSELGAVPIATMEMMREAEAEYCAGDWETIRALATGGHDGQ